MSNSNNDDNNTNTNSAASFRAVTMADMEVMFVKLREKFKEDGDLFRVLFLGVGRELPFEAIEYLVNAAPMMMAQEIEQAMGGVSLSDVLRSGKVPDIRGILANTLRQVVHNALIHGIIAGMTGAHLAAGGSGLPTYAPDLTRVEWTEARPDAEIIVDEGGKRRDIQ